MTQARLTLAIEVSNPTSGPDASQVGLGLIGEDQCDVLGVESVEPGSRQRDDLLPACERLLRAHGKSPADLESIAVDVGPGGFTGLRVAVAAAATVAEALGLGIIAVESTRVAAVDAAARPGAFVVALASKKQSAWAEVFGADGCPMAPVGGRVLSAEEFEALDLTQAESGPPVRLIADGFLPPAWEASAKRRGWLIEPLRLSARSLLMAAAKVPPAATTKPEALRPIYAREPEAVTLWRARHG